MDGALRGDARLHDDRCAGPRDRTAPDGDDGTGSDTPSGYPSSFSHGKYNVALLSILPVGEGLDLTGDGVIDNNLPNALTLANAAVKDVDLSPAGLNDRLIHAIGSGSVVILIQAAHVHPTLRIDYLGGSVDAMGYLRVSQSSYGPDGLPKSRLQGAFESQEGFAVGPAHAEIPISFFEGGATTAIPLEGAIVVGNLSNAGTSAVIGGVVPVDSLIDDVIEPLIPPEGVDWDQDGNVDMTKDEILSLARTMAENESIADIDLGGGKRGISAAMTYTAFPATW